MSAYFTLPFPTPQALHPIKGLSFSYRPVICLHHILYGEVWHLLQSVYGWPREDQQSSQSKSYQVLLGLLCLLQNVLPSFRSPCIAPVAFQCYIQKGRKCIC